MTNGKAHVDDPDYWHKRAEEMRTIADEMTHKETKTVILRIAQEYDWIADLTAARLSRGRT